MNRKITSVKLADALLLPAFCLTADTHDVAQVTNHVASGQSAAYDSATALFHVDQAGVRRVLFLVREPSYDRPAFDDISIRFVGENDEGGVANVEGGADDLRVSIAENATLKLDYAGTNTIRRFTANGVKYPYGVVNSENCPQIIGPGSLRVAPGSRGLLMMLK